MNKKEKKIIDEINNNVPEVNLFNRVEGKIDYQTKTPRKKILSIFAKVLIPTCSVLIVGATAFGVLYGTGMFATSAKNAVYSEAGAAITGGTSAGMAMDIEGTGTYEEIGVEGETTSSSQYEKALTACEASDTDTIDKYVFWKKMIEGKMTDENQQVINDYSSTYNNIQQKINNLINTKNMIIISCKDKNETNINLAKVTLKDSSGKTLFETYSSSKGNAYLFLNETVEENTKVVVSYQNETKEIVIDGNNIPEDRIYTATFENSVNETVTKIDLAFTIDTTGSMGDELNYIAEELSSIIDSLTNTYETYDLKVGIVLYRDDGDEYVTKVNDFTSNYSSVTTYLKKQNANGGGDTPEAVNKALEKTNSLSWREDSVKLCYHVYDAECHLEDYADLYNQYVVSAKKGIKLIPVICSGILIQEFEIAAREEAIITGGTYVYLTSDSGIGNSHDTPTTEDTPEVEYLKDLIIRVTREYIEGTEIDPVPYNKEESSSVNQ